MNDSVVKAVDGFTKPPIENAIVEAGYVDRVKNPLVIVTILLAASYEQVIGDSIYVTAVQVNVVVPDGTVISSGIPTWIKAF